MESRKKNLFFFFKKECDTTFSLSFFLVNTPAITTLEASYTIDKKNPNFMAPFYGWGSTASRQEPLQGGSLFFTTTFPKEDQS